MKAIIEKPGASTRPAFCLIAAIPLLMSGCVYLFGESFELQDMHDPKTGTTATCVARSGRGEASKAEIDTMNACISWYLSQGYVKAGSN